jgi:O-antigen ligase
MFASSLENTVKKLILVGAPLATLFILTGSVTDPVNVTKLFISGGLGLGSLGLFVVFGRKNFLKQYLPFVSVISLFVCFAFISAITSSSPLTQNIYGTFGRNTGFLMYFLVGALALGPLMLSKIESLSVVVLGLQVAGVANVVYCGWVLLFGDFVSWSNPYGNILGFFGNPDFISAFLGMYVATSLAYLFSNKVKLHWRLFHLVLALIALIEIRKSHAIQGLVVSAGGAAIVLFFFIRSITKSRVLNYSYVLGASTVGVLATLGAFQKGPFSFVYKTSVSLRGSYWNAGINMGMDHPFTGVGMDSYGDWYRRARSEHAATVLPGPGTVSNAAHNVVIDIFAYGGWPLLLAYLFVLIFPTIAILRVLKHSRSFDPVFVAMVAGWACYQVQSVISINQVGLAIWGWLLGGAIVAYGKLCTQTTTTEEDNPRLKRKPSNNVISPQLVLGIAVVIGLFIAAPPISADTKWRSALESKDANKIIESLKPSYMNPSDSLRYAQAVQIFAQSNLMDQAHSIALSAIDYNPDYYDAWRNLYFLTVSTPEEKSLALENMKRLDPRNPDVTKP